MVVVVAAERIVISAIIVYIDSNIAMVLICGFYKSSAIISVVN